MRYIVIEYITGQHHPYMPMQKLYRYKDLQTGLLSLGAWTKRSIAKEIVKKKNKEIKFFAVGR